MRSRNTSIPSYRLHKPSGKAVVTLSGQDIYLGPHGTVTSKNEYDRVVKEWMNRGRMHLNCDDQSIFAVAQLVNAFRKSDAIPASQADAYKAVMSLLVRLYGTKPVGELAPWPSRLSAMK